MNASAVIASASRLIVLLLAVAAQLTQGRVANAQYPTVTGQNAGNLFGGSRLTSPEIGHLEGIQRFGQTLRTDPDPGIGYTYRVFPSVDRQAMDQESFLWAFAHFPEAFELKSYYRELARLIEQRRTPLEDRAAVDEAGKKPSDAELEADIETTQRQIESMQLVLRLALGGDGDADQFARYAAGRNTTNRMREPFTSGQRSRALASVDPSGLAVGGAAVTSFGFGVNDNLFSDPTSDTLLVELQQQPLIQIKVRIIEATRNNSADFRSALDYINEQGASAFVQGNNINGNNRSTRAATRLPLATNVLQSGADGSLGAISGSGALINLTTEHLNFITNMLVTDFDGDVLTVPEVVTLNGQNVEFVAGDNRPLPLGLSLVQGTGTVRQNVFYKHIGTLLSITPRIVNWGKHLEGAGDAPIVAQQVRDWNLLAKWMIDGRNIVIAKPGLGDDLKRFASPSKLPIPVATKREMLAELANYSTDALRESFNDQYPAAQQLVAATADEMEIDDLLPPLNDYFAERDEPKKSDGTAESNGIAARGSNLILQTPTGIDCDWKPNECTIDLEILVRESDLNGNNETDNSIANVIQVRSGHGAVMGGLIGTSEIETVSKIPLLGDLPGFGYFFRSKSVDRAKSELLILVEAKVLPNCRSARDESVRDFQLSKSYVEGSLRENPLEAGMCKAGFGPYLPPSCCEEDEFWLQHQQKMRKVVTEFDDIFK